MSPMILSHSKVHQHLEPRREPCNNFVDSFDEQRAPLRHILVLLGRQCEIFARVLLEVIRNAEAPRCEEPKIVVSVV